MSDESSHNAETVPLFSGDSALQHLSRSLRRSVVLLVYHRNGVEMARLDPGTSIVVGREPPANIVIQDGKLSRRHASFTMENGDIVVQDLDSKNGVHVAGKRIDRCVIRPGDEVLLGALHVSILLTTFAHDTPTFDLESHDAFCCALNFETVRAKFFGQTFAVVSIRALKHPKDHLLHWCPRLRAFLRPADRVALYSQESIELLLPEINPENVDECVRSLVAPQNGEAILVAGIAMYPSMATSSEKLISESRHAVQNASASVPVRFANTETSTTWLADTASHDDNIFMTTSPAMRSVIQIVTRVTKANMPVLLQGEAGTGKDVLARLIHENGSRRHKPMICVNCAVIPGTLLEGMLFGHEQRSFTGTNDAQKGLFEAAHGGTLLLDEIGEMTLATQVALLRVLESKRIRRVGGKNDIDVDVRVLATTRGDLEDLCDAGRFLRELYFRLSTMTIVIPPLRNRREDITPLVGRFLEQASKMNDSRPRIMAHDAMELLERYTWPGNIRELRNAIDRAVMIAQGDTVTTRDLPERIQALRIPAPPIAALTPPQNAANRETRSTREVAPSPAKSQFPDKSSWSETDSLKVRIEKAEAHFILDALQTAGWKQKVAAKQLSIPLRTLQYKMRSLGIAKSGQKIGEFKSGGSK